MGFNKYIMLIKQLFILHKNYLEIIWSSLNRLSSLNKREWKNLINETNYLVDNISRYHIHCCTCILHPFTDRALYDSQVWGVCMCTCVCVCGGGCFSHFSVIYSDVNVLVYLRPWKQCRRKWSPVRNVMMDFWSFSNTGIWYLNSSLSVSSVPSTHTAEY